MNSLPRMRGPGGARHLPGTRGARPIPPSRPRAVAFGGACSLPRIVAAPTAPGPRPFSPVGAGARATRLFIANNMYQLDAFASATRLRLDTGKLCLYMANRESRLALPVLAIRGLLGRLEPDRDFTRVSLESVEISVRWRRWPSRARGRHRAACAARQ